MDSEEDFRRPPPLSPYKAGHIHLRVPRIAIEATIQLLRRAGRRESGVLWYGVRDRDGHGDVKYVVAPRQRMTWGNYHVSPAALGEVVHRLHENWKPLAQIHSHPGVYVEHSRYDDTAISSRRILSIVFPLYGNLTSPFPVGIGVHEWQDDYWHLLDDADARRRVAVFEGVLEKVEDLR